MSVIFGVEVRPSTMSEADVRVALDVADGFWLLLSALNEAPMLREVPRPGPRLGLAEMLVSAVTSSTGWIVDVDLEARLL